MDPRVPKEVVDAAAEAAAALAEGMRLRDAGMNSALAHSEKWVVRALALVLIERVSPGADLLTFIGEDDAAMVLREGGGAPEVANAIGGFINGLAAKRLIVKTSERRFMKNTPSHGRDSPVYRYLYGGSATGMPVDPVGSLHTHAAIAQNDPLLLAA